MERVFLRVTWLRSLVHTRIAILVFSLLVFSIPARRTSSLDLRSLPLLLDRVVLLLLPLPPHPLLPLLHPPLLPLPLLVMATITATVDPILALDRLLSHPPVPALASPAVLTRTRRPSVDLHPLIPLLTLRRLS
jgi:hypothetical protein